MINQKDRTLFELRNNEKALAKSTHGWLAQYDEEDDFLSGKVSNVLTEFIEEE